MVKVITTKAPVSADFNLKLGNEAFRSGANGIAIGLYLRAMQTMPGLRAGIAGNLGRARKKYRASRTAETRHIVGIFSRVSSGKSTQRPLALEQLYKTFATVELIGCRFTAVQSDAGEPPRNTPFTYQSVWEIDESQFLDQAVSLVAAKPCDIVHFSQPHAENIFFGLLYKLIWGASVFLDVDEYGPALGSAPSQISVEDYLKSYAKFPDLKDLTGDIWTRLAASLTKEFDGITVSSAALQTVHGGEIILDMNDKEIATALARIDWTQQSLQDERHLVFADSLFAASAARLHQLVANPNRKPIALSPSVVKLAAIHPTLAELTQEWNLAPRLNFQFNPQPGIDPVLRPPSGQSEIPLAPTVQPEGNSLVRNVLPHDDPTEQIWLSQDDLSGLIDERLLHLGGLAVARIRAADEAADSVHLDTSKTLETFCRLARMPDFHAICLLDPKSPGTAEQIKSPNDSECSVHKFSVTPLQIDAIWFANNRDLRIRFNAAQLPNDQTVVMRAFQYDLVSGGTLGMVGEYCLSHAGLQIVDLFLINPYLPILLTLSTPEGYLSDATILPYPSLCPGGAHQAELFALSPHGTAGLPKHARFLLVEHLGALLAPNGWAMSRLMIDIREATGAERIFSSDMREWLYGLFGVQLEAWKMPPLDDGLDAYWREVFDRPPYLNDADMLDRSMARAAQKLGQTLICPPDAIPSLHVLCSTSLESGLARTCGIRSYVIAQRGNPIVRHRITIPEVMRSPEWPPTRGERRLHPFILRTKEEAAGSGDTLGAPIAIVERNMQPHTPIQLVMPIAPEITTPLVPIELPTAAPKIRVIFTAQNIDSTFFAAFLESLKLQRHIEVIEFLLAAPEAENTPQLVLLLQQYFPLRHRVIQSDDDATYADRVRAAMAGSKKNDGTYLLFVNQPVLLHDARTLDTLARLLEAPKAATASCLLIGTNTLIPKATLQSAFTGVFPVLRAHSNDVVCGDAHVLTMFPRDVYPVLANGDAMFLMKASQWEKIGGHGTSNEDSWVTMLDFCKRLTQDGKTHLFTTRISAELASLPKIVDVAVPWKWGEPDSLATVRHSLFIEELPA
ncbi:MAG: hypothetical protein CFE39_05495 [Comamonadaceae bacterium PBBC2]|nr:MAG: hypothetical protein CFE39_05495 [Comamonadaceae bacterium PBBC2]